MGAAIRATDGPTCREFVGGGVACLMLGKAGCGACAAWTEDLIGLLGDGRYAGKVRFGKMLLDQRGLTDFKREHGEWLKDVHDLPFNLIWVNGERKKSWPGGGVERLTNRLEGLAPTT